MGHIFTGQERWDSAMSTCFFIGHRDTGESVRPALVQAVEQHITECGVTDFVVGHYGGFDSLAAGAVRDAKERHQAVTLTLLLPYHPYNQPIPIPEGFDGTFYPPGMETVPKRVAIVRANRYMMENSSHLIAYAWHPASNARELMEYAQAREKKGKIHVENLAEKVGKPFI